MDNNENKILFKVKSLDKTIFRCLSFDFKDDIKKNNIPTPTQMQILEYIVHNADQSVYQRDLEKVLNLRRATVSGVLQTMEKNGLIDRVVHVEDARTKKIILTKKAKDIFTKKSGNIERIERLITKDISSRDLKTFVKVVDKMKQNLNEKYDFRKGI